jgi:hypothetical protein
MKQVVFVVLLMAMASLTGCLNGDDSPVDENTDTTDDSTSDTIEPVGENNLTNLEKRISDLELEVDQLKESLAEVQEDLDNKLNNDGTVNLVPLARIDYPVTNTLLACMDDSIELIGAGYDPDGIVWAYEWSSDIDGVLSEKANMSVSALTTGNHTITFRTQDDRGAWSEPASFNLEFVNNLCPTGSMMASQYSNGTWKVQIIKSNPQISIDDISWELLDSDSNNVAGGLVEELTSDSQGIAYGDYDSNFKLSSGDTFFLTPNEGPFSDITSLQDYRFKLTYIPTGEAIGYMISLS